MTCECDGSGWYLQANYQHEVMEWVQCYSCLAEEKERQDLSLACSKILKRASHEKLCSILGDFLVSSFEKKDDLNRLTEIVDSKDFVNLMTYLEVNLN